MKAHFFDIDTLISSSAKVWIVDKLYPNIPLIKISKSEFNLIKKGIFRNQNSKITFSGETYWLPEDLINNIKIKCKKSKSDISRLAISMQEFMNPDIIEELEHEIEYDNILHLKNTTDDIYIICSKNTKNNYQKFVDKLERKLKDNGLQIKNYYFISETFYNRDEEKISHKKIRILMQHLFGLKTENDKFIDKEITEYDEIEFYEEESTTIEMAKKSMSTLEFLLANTESLIKEKIKECLNKKEKVITTNLISSNKVNKLTKDKIIMKYPNLIKTFESFKMNLYRN